MPLEYNDTQCDKRNTYRRKVKEEKAAVVPPGEGEGEAESNVTVDGVPEATNGATNGHAHVDDDDERPAKKFKGEGGEALAPDADLADDLDEDGQQDGDDDVDEDDGVDDVDDADEDEAQNESMDDPLDDMEAELRFESGDEALDEPDSE